MSKAQFQAALALVRQYQYDEARQILRTIDDPKAAEWLKWIDSLERKRAAAADPRRWRRRLKWFVAALIMLMLVWAALFWVLEAFYRMVSDSPTDLIIEICSAPGQRSDCYERLSTLSNEVDFDTFVPMLTARYHVAPTEERSLSGSDPHVTLTPEGN